jgi:hypothetical protein
MMISSAGASDPYAAAAAFDRQLRASTDDPGEPTPDTGVVVANPDVVVTLGQGTPPGSSTYDASGRMSDSPTLDQLGANAPDSMAQADESDGSDGTADQDATATA